MSDHSTITYTRRESLWHEGEYVVVVTEYRADGCVTWREA